VKRNIERFPQDFMLRLSEAEYAAIAVNIEITRSFVRRRELHAAVVAGIAKLPGFISLEA
jgi:hypothetical protein